MNRSKTECDFLQNEEYKTEEEKIRGHDRTLQGKKNWID